MKTERECIDAEALEMLFDGELAGSSLESARAHMRYCGKCASAFEFLKEGSGWNSDDHPGALVLGAYSEGNLDGAVLELTESHLERCVICRSAVESTAADRAEEVEATESMIRDAVAIGGRDGHRRRRGPAVGGRLRKGPLFRSGLAAASVLVLLATGIWYSQRETDIKRDHRGLSSGLEKETLLFPTGEIRRGPAGEISFEWRSVPGAVLYRLRVVGSDGSPVATIETAATTVTLTRRDGLLDRGEYSWWLEVVLEDGREYRTELVRFRLEAGSDTSGRGE